MATNLSIKRLPRMEFFLAATVGLLILVTTAYQAQSSARVAVDPQAVEGAAVADGLEPSAAAALASGKPILFVFTPERACRIRYCAHPELVAEQVAAVYGDRISVVAVPVQAIPYDAGEEAPARLQVSWNLYTVPPYSEWLPAVQRTPDGWGLNAPTAVLVDSDGTRLMQLDEFFDIRVLEMPLAAGR